MDFVKGIDKYPWVDQCEKINVRQFLSLWESQDLSLELELNEESLDRKAMEICNINEETIEDIKEDLDPEKLNRDKEWKDYLYGNKLSLPNHIALRSVAAQVSHIEKCEQNDKYRRIANQSLKYRNYTFLNNQDASKNSSDEPKIEGLDVILNVQVFRPMHHSLHVGEHRKHVNLIAEQEFLCLGRQLLTALKDEIICSVEVNPAEDCSDDPEKERPSARELYTSSFFFIDDCFYNDFRSANNIDCSQVIMDWAKNKERGIGTLRTAKMEETRFNDLSIRLGQPYVYVHQGDCEHMIVFPEMRLFCPQTDSPFLRDYPKVFKTVNRNACKCLMCHINVAKWIVLENKRLPYEPYFFCNQCFMSFNYDSEKKKIGHFKAFRYLDESAFL
ncbi:snRNA-activating protein complex subunit 3 [Tetranychus urticae]|uniref:snRNA-activating protein complex subunit 3 n=1 Tax=Tetranychus urticae TaxID=32264 RepID=T1KCA1_TETUR|nr:snRNA-activating protein complex subunit 3 [Tetranychus urticae]